MASRGRSVDAQTHALTPLQLDEIYGAPESFLEIEVRSPQTHGTHITALDAIICLERRLMSSRPVF